jgi:hypothetical protein
VQRSQIADVGERHSLRRSFSNDINNLLARVEEGKLPWTAAAGLMSFGIAVTPVAQPGRHTVTPPLRVFDGGATFDRLAAAAGRARDAAAAPRRARRRA